MTGEMFGPIKEIKMTTKTITAECLNCESSYDVLYEEQLVSDNYPEHCPFCGELIEELSEHYDGEDDDDEYNEDPKWSY